MNVKPGSAWTSVLSFRAFVAQGAARQQVAPQASGVLAAAIAVTVVFASGCDSAPRQASAAARRVADLAATPDQARLWREAADTGLAVGLEQAPAVGRPVETRAVANAASQQVVPQPVVIPPGVLTAVRILAAPALVSSGFSGSAAVAELAGERIELNLGQPQRLIVLARAGGRPIATQAGNNVQVAFRTRTDPRIPNDMLAIRTTTGAGIVQAVQGGTDRVTLRVPLFGLVATQTGNPPAMDVDVIVGTAKRTMKPGETEQIGGLNVTVVGSSARTGEAAGRIEGSPYTISLIAWR